MNRYFTLSNTKNIFIPLIVIVMLINYGLTFADMSQSMELIIGSASILIVMIFGIISYKSISNNLSQLDQIKFVTKEASNGLLSNRITNINESLQIGQLAWDINDLLDQVEIFTRDLDSSLEAISKGETHRKMYPSGFKGNFVKYSLNINKAIDRIATAQSKDAFIQDMLEIINLYSANNYTKFIKTGGMQEDIIGLAQGINQLGKTLADLSLENLHNGMALQDGANKLSNDVHQINNGIKEQLDSLAQTNNSLEEMTEVINKSTQNTKQMAKLASDVTNASVFGRGLANDTAKSMEDINSEVLEINEAITVIDQISFQTNILSLNAAVEAATAGESGKGFAVVAQEVRNLASRSAEAASQIKTLVENAKSKADDGKEISIKMIDGYSQLNTNIEKTIELINEVARYGQQQQEKISIINQEVVTLNKKLHESESIANEANIIALQSNDIAQKIVTDAKTKEVRGKENIHIRGKLVDLKYTGPERRKVEKKMRSGEKV